MSSHPPARAYVERRSKEGLSRKEIIRCLKRYAARDISSDELVRRNAAFAATGAFAGLPFPTSDTLQVLGCVDSRVDPSDVLGLKLGEGVVMRNIGGRITPATLRSWALLGRLGQGQPPGAGTW